MILYLYGPDSYRRSQRVQFYRESFIKKHPEAASIDHFDFSQAGETDRLKAFALDQSLFGKGYKFATLENTNEAELSDLKRIFEPVFDDTTTTLIISEEKKLERKLHTFLKRAFKEESFDVVKGAAFRKFLRDESKKRGSTLTPEAENIIMSSHEGDSWGAINQIEKLSLGGKPEISLDAPEMFPLMFALSGSASVEKKLSALAWLLEREEPAKIFNIVAAGKRSEIKKKMADYDVLIKSGKLEYEEALLDLVLQ